jgi:hypothetical protein
MLLNAYFHISILPAHGKFLRFSFQDTACDYLAVPFGLALAPQTFSKCVEAAPTQEKAVCDMTSLLTHLTGQTLAYYHGRR